MVPVWKLVSFHSLNKVFCSAVVDCNPWVEASGSFVESLNESNELSRFVRAMRREFEVLAVRSRYLVK
jgi:hypothetical protein